MFTTLTMDIIDHAENDTLVEPWVYEAFDVGMTFGVLNEHGEQRLQFRLVPRMPFTNQSVEKAFASLIQGVLDHSNTSTLVSESVHTLEATLREELGWLLSLDVAFKTEYTAENETKNEAMNETKSGHTPQ